MSPDEFAELTQTEGIIPAPYLARYHWVQVVDDNRFTPAAWGVYVRQSYFLVSLKLPRVKVRGRTGKR